MSKFKVLCYGSQFVNGAMLEKGIYTTNVPYLYPPGTTMDQLVTRASRQFGNITDPFFNKEGYLENLGKCSLDTYILEEHIEKL